MYDSRNTSLYERYIDLVGPNGIHLIDSLELPVYEDNILIPKIKLNEATLGFHQLSEGTFKTMALLFYIISNDGGLLLLEEPEVGIHYKLLHDIVEIIQCESEYKQIIFSTHSDYVLDMLKPEDIVFIENGENGTKARNLPKELAEGNYKGLRTFLECEGSLGQYWKAGGFDDE
ncbi:hypothetical protein FACS1894164_14220 [Spirochaetia bacterium]|nr:hypothetical protein FACS1894164_14220 [Spirochaetia bacterium]